MEAAEAGAARAPLPAPTELERGFLVTAGRTDVRFAPAGGAELFLVLAAAAAPLPAGRVGVGESLLLVAVALDATEEDRAPLSSPVTCSLGPVDALAGRAAVALEPVLAAGADAGGATRERASEDVVLVATAAGLFAEELAAVVPVLVAPVVPDEAARGRLAVAAVEDVEVRATLGDAAAADAAVLAAAVEGGAPRMLPLSLGARVAAPVAVERPGAGALPAADAPKPDLRSAICGGFPTFAVAALIRPVALLAGVGSAVGVVVGASSSTAPSFASVSAEI